MRSIRGTITTKAGSRFATVVCGLALGLVLFMGTSDRASADTHRFYSSFTGDAGFQSGTITGSDVSKNGDLWVSTTNGIYRFDETGDQIAKFFVGNNVTDVAVDKNENFYRIAGNVVTKYSESGLFLGNWGGPGAGNGTFNTPVAIAVGRGGDIYVADSGQNLIQRFDSAGNFLNQWSTAAAPVALDANQDTGTVYVVSASTQFVYRFDRTGAFQSFFGGPGGGNGQFSTPSSLSIGEDDNVYVGLTTCVASPSKSAMSERDF